MNTANSEWKKFFHKDRTFSVRSQSINESHGGTGTINGKTAVSLQVPATEIKKKYNKKKQSRR
jgi:hypothetical protein